MSSTVPSFPTGDRAQPSTLVCQCGCQSTILVKESKIRELEEWVKNARETIRRQKEKYKRVGDEKMAVEQSKAVVEGTLHDVIEENERLQQEIEDKRRRIRCREDTAAAHARNARDRMPQTNTQGLPDEAQKTIEPPKSDENLAQRLLECLTEANAIAEQLARREMRSGQGNEV